MPRSTANLMLSAMLLVSLACSGALRLAAQATPAPTPSPRPAPTAAQSAIQAASEKDHQRLMDLMSIKELRSAGHNVKTPYGPNFDESKANIFPNLPDPLLLKDGKRVTTAKMWWTKRRAEIIEDYDREIFGRPPANLPKVKWEMVSATPEKVGEVAVLTKRLVGHVDNSSWPQITVNIDLTLTTPANAAGPVPVIMELAFSREAMAGFARTIPAMVQGNPGNQTPGDHGMTWQQQVLARGWGYAILIPASFQADNGAGLTEGIIGLMNKGQPRSKPEEWGTIKAWVWGASRALDYFETDKAVDAKQVGLEGHSRFGKTALVAMAYDPRFAIVYSSSSGEGGAKLYRHIYGEPLANVAGSGLYHWMDGNFLKYAGPLTPGDLPVDNHELIALCAPRPVFIGGGSSADGADGWADSRGMFLAAVAAGPVYRLLGKRDLGTTEFPPAETALIDGEIAFRQHTGGHTPGPNWPTFLNFASRYLHGPGAK